MKNKFFTAKEVHVHPLFLVLIAVSLGSVGQVFLKTGMGGTSITGSFAEKGMELLRAIINPYVLIGLSLYVISTLFWLVVLSTQKLSYVYPMIAVGYVLTTMLSFVILHERVKPLGWLALLVICLGVAMLAVLGGDQASSKTKNPQTKTETNGPLEKGRESSAKSPQINPNNSPH